MLLLLEYYAMSVRRSLAWTYLAQVLSFVVTFGSTVMIARIVSPRDFGVFAMATAVATIINVFMQFGLAKYVMREKEMTQDVLRSVFTVNVMMSAIYIIAILIGSVAAGRLFHSPRGRPVLAGVRDFPVVRDDGVCPRGLVHPRNALRCDCSICQWFGRSSWRSRRWRSPITAMPI